jgi:hypothetical protein
MAARRKKHRPEVVRLALVAVAVAWAEVVLLRDVYLSLKARMLAGEDDPGLCDRHDEVMSSYFESVERREDARNGVAVTWPPGPVEPLDLVPIRPDPMPAGAAASGHEIGGGDLRWPSACHAEGMVRRGCHSRPFFPAS